jgi:hypothetical protein
MGVEMRRLTAAEVHAQKVNGFGTRFERTRSHIGRGARGSAPEDGELSMSLYSGDAGARRGTTAPRSGGQYRGHKGIVEETLEAMIAHGDISRAT